MSDCPVRRQPAASGDDEDYRDAKSQEMILKAFILLVAIALRRLHQKAGCRRVKGSSTYAENTWRATGITIYLENDGRLEHAQQMAGHESPRTTKLYDRTKDEITLSEV
jgi:hypothetical protein